MPSLTAAYAAIDTATARPPLVSEPSWREGEAIAGARSSGYGAVPFDPVTLQSVPLPSRLSALHDLVDALAAARIGVTFNQYRETGGDDATLDAPVIRRRNLLHYLSTRVDAPVVLVAEAAGWRGARYSGLCLYCERQIDEATTPLRRTSTHPRGWVEPSATVVQAAIAPWAGSVLLWNAVPTHPRRDAVDHSNRTPTRADLVEGERWLRRLLDVIEPRHVAAIGRSAARVLGADAPSVRHPSHGGAVATSQGLRRLLTDWLGPGG